LSPLFLITVLQSFLMQHLTCDIMICHVTLQKYKPLTNKLNFYMAIACLIIVSTYVITPNFFDKNIDMTKCVIGLLVVTIIC